MKPRAVVRPYDGREESDGQGGGRRENVWSNRSINAPTAYGQAQPRREEASQQVFPPLAQNIPRQGGSREEEGRVVEGIKEMLGYSKEVKRKETVGTFKISGSLFKQVDSPLQDLLRTAGEVQ